jgi:hypothetical protein
MPVAACRNEAAADDVDDNDVPESSLSCMGGAVNSGTDDRSTVCTITSRPESGSADRDRLLRPGPLPFVPDLLISS